MSVTETVKCRAKDPSTCRFHGTTNTYSIYDLKTQAAEAAKTGNNTKYFEIQDDIREREREENEMRVASWTAEDKQEAATSFLTNSSSASYQVKNVAPEEYEIDYSENMKDLLDKLEDDGVEVEINYVVSDYDVIQDAYVPILNTTISNSARDEEVREHIPAYALGEDYWFDG